MDTETTVEDLTADPHPHHHRWRASAPIVWVDALGGWVVTERDTAVRVMRDAASFTVDDPRFTTGQVVGPSMLSIDGVEHERHRRPFAAAFRDAGLRARLTEHAQAAARSLVEDVRPRGGGDLRAALAGPLAVSVMSEALELDASVDEVRSVYQAIVAAVESRSAGRADAPSGDAMARLTALVRAGLTSGSPVLVDALATLSFEEIVSNVAVVLFGGVETTEDSIATALWYLLGDRETREQATADPSRLGAIADEAMRLEPAAVRVDRYATRDVTLVGTEIRAGDLVIVSLAGANRDPDVFDHPDDFSPGRPAARHHVTFALGPHACIAGHVARIEVIAAMRAVLEGLPGVRLDAGAVAPTGLVFRRPERVPAVWDG